MLTIAYQAYLLDSEGSRHAIAGSSADDIILIRYAKLIQETLQSGHSSLACDTLVCNLCKSAP